MASRFVDWQTVTLGELGQLRNGVNFSKDDYGAGIPIINVKQLYRGRFAATQDLLELRKESVRNLDSVQLKAGDILFARSSVKASGAGQVAMVAACPPDAVFSGFIIRYRVEALDRADPSFLNYVLRSPVYRELLTRIGSGTTITNLSQDTLRGVELDLPPLSEQRAIAHILGTLDDKIELNRRMNETLEAIARALFKSWFVDFDSVRAKAEGRDTGLPKPLADLFPSSFEHSELGEIPKGWCESSVHKLAAYINGAAYRAFDPNEERRGLPIIKIAELKAGVTAQTRFSAVDMPDKYRIDTGDILFSWSGNPDTSIDIFVWTHGPAWLNQHIFRVVPRSVHERAFLLMTLRTLRPVFAEIARNKQTTGLGHVTLGDLKRLLSVCPPESVLRGWNILVEPVLARSFGLEEESNTLAGLRDTLLPKLISGELRVKDAERMIGNQS